MLEIINIIVIHFVTDLLLCLLLRKSFKLSVHVFEVFALQIINIAPVIIYIFCGISDYIFIIIKLVAGLLVIVLITDSFVFKNLFKLCFTYVILFFSIYGISRFLILFFSSVFYEFTGTKIAFFFQFIVFLFILTYIMLIFILTHSIAEYKILKNYLAEVSFSILGKHIEVIGLLDSGNTLKDKLTKKPVVVVSVSVLKKYFGDIPELDLENGYFCERKINCVSAGGIKFEMPIFDVGAVCIKSGNDIKSYKCVLGFVNQKFYDERDYQCLLHRDFI